MTVLMNNAPVTAKTQAITAKNIKPEASGVADLVEKMRADEQFLFGITIIRFFCATVPVSIETSSSDPRAEIVRENLEALWYRKQKQMFESVEYGRVAFEKVYSYVPFDGVYKLDQLNELDYKQSSLKLDDQGQFAGVKYSTLTLTSDESWWLAINTTATEPHGKSIYLGAPYTVWKLRRQHDRNFEMWFKRFAIGRGVGFAPSVAIPSTSDEGRDGEVSQDGSLRNPMMEMKKALQQMEAGGDVIFPSECDQSGKRFYEYTAAQDLKDGKALFEAQQVLDNKALRSLIIPDRAITQDAATGSRAVADTHLRVFYSIIEGLVAGIVESFQDGIIEPTCQINDLEPDVITITYQPLGDEAKELIRQIVQTVLSATAINPIIVQGVIDLPAMLRSAGIPLGPNVDAAMEAVKATSVAPPTGPPAPGGFPRSFSILDEIVAGNARRRTMLRELSNVPVGE